VIVGRLQSKLPVAADGVAIGHRDRDLKWTALMHAAWNGNKRMVELLLGVPGCSETVLNCTDARGRTALMLAVEKGHIDVVCVLLQQGAIELHHCDDFGRTALILACKLDHAAICDELVQADTRFE